MSSAVIATLWPRLLPLSAAVESFLLYPGCCALLVLICLFHFLLVWKISFQDWISSLTFLVGVLVFINLTGCRVTLVCLRQSRICKVYVFYNLWFFRLFCSFDACIASFLKSWLRELIPYLHFHFSINLNLEINFHQDWYSQI